MFFLFFKPEKTYTAIFKIPPVPAAPQIKFFQVFKRKQYKLNFMIVPSEIAPYSQPEDSHLEPALPAKMQAIEVVLPLPISDGYTYLPPQGQPLPPTGAFVTVPLGKNQYTGIVWGPAQQNIAPDKLKSILSVEDIPGVSALTRQFVEWVAAYTLAPKGAIVKMLLGGKFRPLKPKDIIKAAITDFTLNAPTEADEKSASPSSSPPTLNALQEKAADVLRQQIKAQKFSVTLLDGVTGSGKTETYCEAIAASMAHGQQVLVLLPEIAMTSALLHRLTERFGFPPTEWHSALSEKQRRLNWHAILTGRTKFIVGARSALFLPYHNLGLIVVDEEHESAYKQEEGVIYHGRDMAVVRGHIGNFPVILATATPSLETLCNVKSGKYAHVKLSSRFGKAEMPHIIAIDMRQETMPPQNFLSLPLLTAIQQNIEKGQQTLLFLNRRGYAPLTLCRTCGYRLSCPNCSSWLIMHKKTNRMHCHHCEYHTALLKQCPACLADDKFAACGPGVERIAEEVKTRLPEARSAIFASDTLDNTQSAENFVTQMLEHKLDIIIGTQIMAKGFHFPRLTLVGVVDADLGLAGGDPRAAEKTFQLLQQVSGRSGRGDDAGQVILQTYAPTHPVISALLKNDQESFLTAELNERQAFNLPPFSRLAALTIAGEDQNKVIAYANELAAKAPRHNNLRILGPAPAQFALLRGKHRYRLLLQADKKTDLSKIIKEWLALLPPPRSLQVKADIDPYSFL